MSSPINSCWVSVTSAPSVEALNKEKLKYLPAGLWLVLWDGWQAEALQTDDYMLVMCWLPEEL